MKRSDDTITEIVICFGTLFYLHGPQRYRRVAVEAGGELQQHREGVDVGEGEVPRRVGQHGLHARLDGGRAGRARPHRRHATQPELVMGARLEGTDNT